MLPKARRAPAGLFPRKALHTRSGKFLFVKVAPNRAGFRRYAVVVPKAALAKAVRRNRLKRSLYRLLGKARDGRAEDVMVIVRRVPAGFAELEAELNRLVP